MASIKLHSVYKDFGETQVIRDVSLSIDDNEFVVFVGPSGCGKSTLLRLISGLEDITSGQIEIDNERIDHLPPSQRGIAMVFQSYALYPHMSVYENMSYALKIAKESKAGIDIKVKKAAQILQLTEFLDRKPKALSGGQRQRVAIGRAIVRNPKIFLFDEPLSNLDAKLRVQTRIELTKLHKKLNATMIYVTHDQVEAMTMADKIVVLRDGIIEQVGAPLELYHKPINKFVAGFIGSPAMNFFEGVVTAISDTMISLNLENNCEISYPSPSMINVAINDNVQLGIRPEHVTISIEGDAQNKGEIFAVERLGGETYIYVETKNEPEVIIHVSGDVEVEVGQIIGFDYDTNSCHLFGANGIAIR